MKVSQTDLANGVLVEWFNASGSISMHKYSSKDRSQSGLVLYSFIYEGDAYMYNDYRSNLYVLPADENLIYKVSRRGNWKIAPNILPCCKYSARQVGRHTFCIYGMHGNLLITMGVGNERSWHVRIIASDHEPVPGPDICICDDGFIPRNAGTDEIHYIEKGINVRAIRGDMVLMIRGTNWPKYRTLLLYCTRTRRFIWEYSNPPAIADETSCVTDSFLADNVVCTRNSLVDRTSIRVTYMLINICDNTVYETRAQVNFQ